MQDKGSSTFLCSFHFKTKHPYNGHIFKPLLVVSQQMFNYTIIQIKKKKKTILQIIVPNFRAGFLFKLLYLYAVLYFKLKPLRDNSDNVNSVSF